MAKEYNKKIAETFVHLFTVSTLAMDNRSSKKEKQKKVMRERAKQRNER
jgi:hypothetical protein